MASAVYIECVQRVQHSRRTATVSNRPPSSSQSSSAQSEPNALRLQARLTHSANGATQSNGASSIPTPLNRIENDDDEDFDLSSETSTLVDRNDYNNGSASGNNEDEDQPGTPSVRSKVAGHFRRESDWIFTIIAFAKKQREKVHSLAGGDRTPEDNQCFC